jgi:response regulator RpfG family c-di-GMP phosphodiesterase
VDSPAVAPPAAAPLPRVLAVDDEPNVLQGLTLILRKVVALTTASSGAEGLEKIKQAAGAGGFAVIISDMRMPGMDGAQFLAQARQIAPDSTRILLTGQSELAQAVKAVNEGQLFRFLTKPCPPELLVPSIQAAVAQHALVHAERELLEKTLRGSVQTLTDILSLVSPAAFGRANRVKRLVAIMADVLQLSDRWVAEVASMFWPIGYVVLPQKTAEKVLGGKPLDPDEKTMAEKVPAVTRQLLGHIPRLGPVVEILEAHTRRFDGGGLPPVDVARLAGDRIPLGARVLRVALDYDQLDDGGLDQATVIKTLRGRAGIYDVRILDALEAGLERRKGGRATVLSLPLKDLLTGMVLAADVLTASGTLLVTRGNELTPGTLARLRNFASTAGIREPVLVFGDA